MLLCSSPLLLAGILIGGYLGLTRWITPVRIAGDSMAETLLGRHVLVFCQDCRFPFRCGQQFPPSDGRATCPNCGFRGNDWDTFPLRPGEKVFVERASLLWRPPRRWEAVALRDPSQSHAWAVKRVLGLPGEQIQIVDGEVLVDGQLARKPLNLLRTLRVLVHDQRYRPRRAAANPAWIAEPDSGWRSQSGGFVFQLTTRAANIDGSSWQWVRFHPRRTYAGPRGGEAAPLVDLDPYNQGKSRILREIRDISLRCRIRATDSAGLRLLGHDGFEPFVVHLDAGANGQLYRSDRPVTSIEFAGDWQDRWLDLEYFVCDRQVLLVIDGTTMLQWPYDRTEREFRPSGRPLAIGARRGRIEVQDLQVFRDIYYLPPFDWQQTWKSDARFHEGIDRYVVLGDNPPVSRDSRHWSPGGVAGSALLGRLRGGGGMAPR